MSWSDLLNNAWCGTSQGLTWGLIQIFPKGLSDWNMSFMEQLCFVTALVSSHHLNVNLFQKTTDGQHVEYLSEYSSAVTSISHHQSFNPALHREDLHRALADGHKQEVNQWKHDDTRWDTVILSSSLVFSGLLSHAFYPHLLRWGRLEQLSWRTTRWHLNCRWKATGGAEGRINRLWQQNASTSLLQMYNFDL